MRRLAVLAAVFAFVLALGAPQALAAKDKDTHVQLLAVNDFHGNLQPPAGSSGRIDVGCCDAVTSNGVTSWRPRTVDAGGVEYLATHIKMLRERNSNTITVGGGDLIGASPLISGLFHDEPTIESMNLLGLDVTSVGNHEFDEGVDELLRMQFGGCHPVDGCQDQDPFAGAVFQYLAANVFYTGQDKTILPPYEIKQVGNTKIAFIGLTLEGTPLIVTPAGVAGLEFRPEVQAINALVEKLHTGKKIGAFVVLIHQGGQQNPPAAGPYPDSPNPDAYVDVNRCANFSGAIMDIVDGLSPEVDVVVSAHTHQPYVCDIDGKLVTSASSFGRVVTDIDLVIDHQSKEVTSKEAHNVIVTRDVDKDAAQTALIAKYDAISAPIANRVVGGISADLTRSTNSAGESSLGDVIADAQLASTSPTDFGGSVVAFMNPGGIRADITCVGTCPSDVTYNQLFTAQPFSNVLTVKTLTGSQIEQLLEQQWCGSNVGAVKILQVSAGFTYSYDGAGIVGGANTTGDCDRVDIGDIMLGGTAIGASTEYRVTMNSFLATGGDGFGVFNDGTDQLGGEIDLDALVTYFMDNSPIGPGPQDRITLG